MAVKTGQYAKVMLDVNGTAVQVMELRDWSVSVSSEKIDSSVAGDDWSKHEIGRFSWEGEATCVSADQFWLKHIGTKLTVDFFDHQDDVNAAYQGDASFDFERSSSHEDLIESSLSFTGSGTFTSPAEAAQTTTTV